MPAKESPEEKTSIGPANKIQVGLAVTIVGVVVGAAWFARGVMLTIQYDIRDLKAAIWRVEDMKDWTRDLKDMNQSMVVPRPENTVKARLAAEAARGNGG